ncbi:MAG: hypothetical protein AAF960_21680 [Bacteroidota bacterium]
MPFPNIGENLPDKREQAGFNIFPLVKQNLAALLQKGELYRALSEHWGKPARQAGAGGL